MPSPFTFFIIVAAIIVVVLLLLICWKRVPADKAMVITGLKKRVLVGKGGVQVPFLETSCLISLESVSMTTDITEAPSKQGIFVDIAGTAVVKVDNDPQWSCSPSSSSATGTPNGQRKTSARWWNRSWKVS